MIEDIAKNDKLQNMMIDGKLKILAITPDAEYNDWQEHIYPSNRHVGYDREKTIFDQPLYDIQHFPCMYLLDDDKRVLLNEANYERLCNFLSNKKI